MIVNSYGLHWVGGVPFLLQGGGATNLISPELGNPFTLKLPLSKVSCPHNIRLDAAASALPDWLEDPLVQALLPLPGPRGGVIKLMLDPHDRYATIVEGLVKLASPIEPPIQPVWWNSSFSHRRRYMATNLGALVWTGVEARSIDRVIEHCDMTRVFHRTTLIVAREELPIYRSVEKIQTGLTRLPDGDLEAIGAGALRRLMSNGEQADLAVPG
jgi:hypothetical protein